MSKTRDSACTLLTALTTFGPLSLGESAAMAAMNEPAVSGWIAALRKVKLVHIAGWRADSRGYMTIALFAWNPGAEDVPCPAKSGSQRVRDYRNRLKVA